MKSALARVIAISLLAISTTCTTWAAEKSDGKLEIEFAVRVNGKYEFVDGNGKTVVPTRFDEVIDLGSERIAVWKNGRAALWTRDGRVLTPYKYDLISIFFEDRGLFVEGNRVGYLDPSGKEVIKLDGQVDLDGLSVHDSDGGFFGEYAVLKVNKRAGVINRSGKWVMKPKYRYIQPLDNGIFSISALALRN